MRARGYANIFALKLSSVPYSGRREPESHTERWALPVFRNGVRLPSGPIARIGLVLLTCCPAATCIRAQSSTVPAPVDADSGPGLRWTTARRLNGVPAGQALLYPSLAFKGDTLYVAGRLDPTGTEARPSVQPPPVLVFRVPGGDVGRPEGPFAFLYVRGVVTPDGKYHLFWGEPDSVPRATPPLRFLPRAKSVWHSSYDGAWSRPERVLNEFQIGWEQKGNLVTIDGEGRLHIAVTELLTHRGFALAHLRTSASGWQRTDSPIPIGNSGSILAWGRDSLAIAYAGFASAGSREGARVRLLVSGDGGTTWSMPANPPSSARDPDAPMLSRSADGVLHVGWREAGRPGARSSGWEFRSWTSADGGVTWQDRGALPVPSFGTFISVPGLCRGSAFIVESSDGQTFWLTQVTFQESPSMRRLFSTHVGSGSPGLAVHGRKLAMVLLAVRTPTEPALPWIAEADACPR